MTASKNTAPAAQSAATLARYRISAEAVQAVNASITEGREAITRAVSGDFAATLTMGAAICDLQGLLTQDQNILGMLCSLQGRSLGFRTDKDTQGGYPAQTVAACCVEAYLKGLPPVGNCWNIIANRVYVTREGYEFLLRQSGVKYSLLPGLPGNERQLPGLPGKPPVKMVTAPVAVRWGDKLEKCQNLEFEIRQNAGMTTDAVIGKAKAKALKWLYEQWQTNPLLAVEAVDSLEGAAPSAAAIPTAAGVAGRAKAIADGAPARKPFAQVWLEGELRRNGVSGDAAAILSYAASRGYSTDDTRELAEAMPRILQEMQGAPAGDVQGIGPDGLPDEAPAGEVR